MFASSLRRVPAVSSAPLSLRSRSSLRVRAAATIAVGDTFPSSVSLNYFDKEGSMQTVTSDELTKGKRVILFAVPGGFISRAKEMRSKGIDDVCCVAVNDAFVMDAWGKSVEDGSEVIMLADGSAELTKALGVELDLTDKGLGVRSRRYAMLVDDGVVSALNLEEGGEFTISSAEDMMKKLE